MSKPEPQQIKLENLEKIVELDRFRCVHSISDDFRKIVYLNERCDKCSGYNVQCFFYFPNNKIYEERR